MKLTVIGCGRWGSFLGWYLSSLNHSVTLYGRKGSKKFEELKRTRRNEYITYNDSIILTDELSEAVKNDYIFISISAQGFRSFMSEFSSLGVHGKKIVLCMKGLEQSTGKRLSEIAKEYLDPNSKVAIWSGPGHIQDFTKGIPNCMVIDSDDKEYKYELIELLKGDLIRFYIGSDIIGNELGAAAKNVYGIAAGMLDAVGYTSLKGALVVRSAVEMSRLIGAMGGNPQSVWGLSFLGECETTFFSKHSNNRSFGENFINGVKSDKLSEGYYTIEALCLLADKTGTDMPICHALYDIIYKGSDPKTVFGDLFLRTLKKEFI